MVSTLDQSQACILVSEGIEIPSRVFVGRVPFNVSENELLEIFKPYGEIVEAKIICDRNGLSRGFGFVTFSNEEDAQKLLKKGKLRFKSSFFNLSKAIRRQGGQFDQANREFVNGQRQVSLLAHHTGEYLLKYSEDYGVWYAEPLNYCDQFSTKPLFSMLVQSAAQQQQYPSYADHGGTIAMPPGSNRMMPPTNGLLQYPVASTQAFQQQQMATGMSYTTQYHDPAVVQMGPVLAPPQGYPIYHQ